MTDYGKIKNPIIEAWDKYPEWRADFVKKTLIERYKGLFTGLYEYMPKEIDAFKQGSQDEGV